MVRKVMGWQGDDGKFYASLDEALGAKYKKQIQEIVGHTVLGPATIMQNSKAIAKILNEYNAELEIHEHDDPFQ